LRISEDGTAQGALAGADLAGDLDEALALGDAVDDVLEGLPVAATEVQIPRVRGDVEGLGLEVIEILIHRRRLTIVQVQRRGPRTAVR
jgi:hypothetical protein